MFSGEASGSPSPDSSIGSLGRDVDGWEAVGMFEVRQPGQQVPSKPSEPSEPSDGNDGNDGIGSDAASGGEAGGEKTDTPDAIGGDTGTVGNAVDGEWSMPKDPKKRAALVQTGYTAGGLAAGIAIAGIVSMVARAVWRRRE